MIDSDDVKTISKLADSGNAEMQVIMGKLYLEGEGGLPSDKQMAAIWFKKAADQKNPEAQLFLGAIYVSGVLGESKIEEGLTLVTESAMNGNESALKLLQGCDIPSVHYVLGLMYLYGRGVDLDKKEARFWLRKAYTKGDEDAAFYLGIMSAEEDDFDTAFRYIEEAAKKGQKDALEVLSNIGSNSNNNSSDRNGSVLSDFSNTLVETAKGRMANKVLDVLIETFLK